MNLILSMLATVATLADDVTINPTAEGMPGGEAMQKLVNWLGQGALVASLAAVAAGGGLMARWVRCSPGWPTRWSTRSTVWADGLVP